jgi:hypothetical protein
MLKYLGCLQIIEVINIQTKSTAKKPTYSTICHIVGFYGIINLWEKQKQIIQYFDMAICLQTRPWLTVWDFVFFFLSLNDLFRTYLLFYWLIDYLQQRKPTNSSLFFQTYSEAAVPGFPYCTEPGLNFSTAAAFSEDDADFAPGRRGKASRVSIMTENFG